MGPSVDSTELHWNRHVLGHFMTLHKSARLAHAYLLIGPPGIGKGETALVLAKWLNCEGVSEDGFCRQCPSCLKIDSGNHPDVHILDNPPGESIKIEQVREVTRQSRLRPFMSQKKIFIIRGIETMTADGANAFLKTLEEPTRESLLLLTSSAPENILDTVKSRCHKIFFPPMKAEGLAREFMGLGIGVGDARCLAYFAQGSYGAARKLQESGFIEIKNEVIDEFILRRPDESFIKKLLEDKERIKSVLVILLSWMRDALLRKAGVNDQRLVHLDRAHDVKQFAQGYSFKELQELYDSVVKMEQLLADKLNIKVPLYIIGEQLWGR